MNSRTTSSSEIKLRRTYTVNRMKKSVDFDSCLRISSLNHLTRCGLSQNLSSEKSHTNTFPGKKLTENLKNIHQSPYFLQSTIKSNSKLSQLYGGNCLTGRYKLESERNSNSLFTIKSYNLKPSLLEKLVVCGKEIPNRVNRGNLQSRENIFRVLKKKEKKMGMGLKTGKGGKAHGHLHSRSTNFASARVSDSKFRYVL